MREMKKRKPSQARRRSRHRHQRTHSLHHRRRRIRPQPWRPHHRSDLQSQFPARRRRRFRHRHRSRPRGRCRIDPHESRHGAQNGAQHDLHRSHDPSRLRLWQLMVNVWTKNEKLVQRAIRILEQATGADSDTASRALEAAGNRTSRSRGHARRRSQPIAGNGRAEEDQRSRAPGDRVGEAVEGGFECVRSVPTLSDVSSRFTLPQPAPISPLE